MCTYILYIPLLNSVVEGMWASHIFGAGQTRVCKLHVNCKDATSLQPSESLLQHSGPQCWVNCVWAVLLWLYAARWHSLTQWAPEPPQPGLSFTCPEVCKAGAPFQVLCRQDDAWHEGGPESHRKGPTRNYCWHNSYGPGLALAFLNLCIPESFQSHDLTPYYFPLVEKPSFVSTVK